MWTEQPPGLPMSSPLEEFATSDGWMLRSTVFTPDRAVALAIFIPAREGHLEQYLPIALTMARAGVIVVVPTQRAKQGGIRDLAGLAARRRSLSDVLELLRAAHREHPSLPIFMGAHSSACSLLLRAIPRLDTAVQGVFFIDPGHAGHSFHLRLLNPWRRFVQNLSEIWGFIRDGWNRNSVWTLLSGGPRVRDADASWDRLRVSVPLFAALDGRRHRMFGSTTCLEVEWPGVAGSPTLLHIASPDDEDVVAGTCLALRRWLLNVYGL